MQTLKSRVDALEKSERIASIEGKLKKLVGRARELQAAEKPAQ